MSTLEKWFKEHEQFFPLEESQLLKDFIDGKITHGCAAKLFTKNINMNSRSNSPLYSKSKTIISLAICSYDSAIQKRLVKLASAIRNLRRRSMNSRKRNKISPYNILFEMDEIIGNLWHCKYFYLLFFSLTTDAKCDKLSSFGG